MIWTVVIVIVEIHITVEQTGIIVSVCRCAFYPYSRSIVRNVTTVCVCVAFGYGGFFMPFFRENGGLL